LPCPVTLHRFVISRFTTTHVCLLLCCFRLLLRATGRCSSASSLRSRAVAREACRGRLRSTRMTRADMLQTCWPGCTRWGGVCVCSGVMGALAVAQGDFREEKVGALAFSHLRLGEGSCHVGQSTGGRYYPALDVWQPTVCAWCMGWCHTIPGTNPQTRKGRHGQLLQQ
jgi:hypothetical protein